MFVTELVFQLPISWLNWLAPLNIWYMSVTELVFQPLISWLNVDLPRNAYRSEVSVDTSQVETSSLPFQAFIFVSVMYVPSASPVFRYWAPPIWHPAEATSALSNRNTNAETSLTRVSEYEYLWIKFKNSTSIGSPLVTTFKKHHEQRAWTISYSAWPSIE